MQKEMADKQTQLQLSNQQYNELVAKLEEALATIAMDTADIQKLEQQLREGMVCTKLAIIKCFKPHNSLNFYCFRSDCSE